MTDIITKDVYFSNKDNQYIIAYKNENNQNVFIKYRMAENLLIYLENNRFALDNSFEIENVITEYHNF